MNNSRRFLIFPSTLVRHKWIINCILIVCFFAVLLALCPKDHFKIKKINNGSSRGVPKKKIGFIQINPSHNIKDFTYCGYKEGRRILSLKADAFVIDKKKIGFFRCALFNTAKLHNAVIDIYGTEKTLNNPGLSSDYKVEYIKGVHIPDLFSGEDMKKIMKTQIISLELEPAMIRIHDEKGLIVSIRSSSAKIQTSGKEIIFDKKVLISSGSNILECNRATFLLANSFFRISRPFVLKTPEKELKGNYIEIDLYLQHIFSFNESIKTAKR